MLGVCLGHQGLGQRARAARSRPRRSRCTGACSSVQHVGSGLFAGIPQDFSVVRYHSLAVTGPLGPEGRVTAWTDDGVVMGVEHRQPPAVGRAVPPRVDRDRARPGAGRELLRARRAITARSARCAGAAQVGSAAPPPARRVRPAGTSNVELRVRTLDGRAVDRAAVRTAVRRAPSTRSGSTAPTRRRRSRSAPTSARAPAPRAACSSTTSREDAVTHAPRRREQRSSTARSSTCSTASSPSHAIEPPAQLAARAARRLRRLPRLRVQGRLRLAQRAPLGPPRRAADARQPRRRGRPRPDT